MRKSIQPTYDSAKTGPRYHVTYKLDGRVITWRERLDDPFVRAVLRVSWLDRLKSLLRREMEVEVLVDADPEVIEDILELDANYLGLDPSTRREESRQDMHKALLRFGKEREAEEADPSPSPSQGGGTDG